VRLSEVPTTLNNEQLRILPPRQRDQYVQQTVLEILRTSKHGVTVSAVSSLTGFSRPTVSKHLDILVAVGESYKVEHGNLSIYYKNGIVAHPDAVQRVTFEERTYVLYRLKNEEGDFVYIQECEPDEYKTNVRVKGGITIPMKELNKFIAGLTRFAKENDGFGREI
jgi:DNA-binding transcriptional ArsR family regulator